MGSKCPAGSTPGCRPRAWLTPASSDREVRSACAQAPGGSRHSCRFGLTAPACLWQPPAPGNTSTASHALVTMARSGQASFLPLSRGGSRCRSGEQVPARTRFPENWMPRLLRASPCPGPGTPRLLWLPDGQRVTAPPCHPPGVTGAGGSASPAPHPLLQGAASHRAPLAAEPRLRLHRGGGTETRDHGGGKPGTPPCAPAPG